MARRKSSLPPVPPPPEPAPKEPGSCRVVAITGKTVTEARRNVGAFEAAQTILDANPDTTTWGLGTRPAFIVAHRLEGGGFGSSLPDTSKPHWLVEEV